MAIRVSSKTSIYFDGCLFLLFGLHIIFNGLLIAAAIKKSPTLTEPWLGLNVLVWMFVMVRKFLKFFKKGSLNL
ncbi:MAG: hypothetical protein FJX80_16700 [Bacteroidetes bacterium]|nr:hypothetical protein [Bacteroidota bacterium]